QVTSTNWAQGVAQTLTFTTAQPAGTTFAGKVHVRLLSGATAATILQLVITYADGTPTQYVNRAISGWTAGGGWVEGTSTFQTARPVSRIRLAVVSNTASPQAYLLDGAELTVQ